MRRVLELLESRDGVQVSELTNEFSVSAVTVRHDLSELARRGLVARVRGGVRALQRGQSELAFDVRLRLQADEKRAMARAAAAMVGDGEAVALDSSTSAYYLALELRRKRELVVVTNGLLIAAALAESPGVNVLVTGGMLRLPAMSLVGEVAADSLRATRIDKGFFGARGLSLERGLMDLNPEEVRLKQELAAACERVLGLYDGVLDGMEAGARAAGGRVASLGVDTWGVDFALLDRRGRLLQNPVHHRDARSERGMASVLAQVPARELYEVTGIQLMPIN